MKKSTLLSFVAVLIVSCSQAQINKGTILIGGSAGAGRSKNESLLGEQVSSNYGISPSFAVAVKQNFTIGFSLNYSRSSGAISPNGPGKQVSNGYGAGVFARSYAPLSKKFYLFGQGGVGAYATNQKYKDIPTPSPKIKSFNVGLNAFPGVAFDVNRWLQLETSLPQFVSINYSRQRNIAPNGDENKTSNISANVNISPATELNLGIRILFR